MKELLLLLCRYPFDPVNKDRLKELLNHVEDWDKTVKLINAHGIIALAAYNIMEAGLEKEIPEDAMAILENGQRQSMVRNLWLTERWKEVNTILSDAGIKHILLKGMALEHTLYGSKGLRQMNDNDILVKREDALRAWNLLRPYGFDSELMKSPLHKKIMINIGKHLPCLYKDGYAIEIHHKLFNSNIFNYERNDNRCGVRGAGCKVQSEEDNLIDDAVEISIGDRKTYILPKDKQLMHLVDHFERHAREGSVQMRQYADIMLLDKKCPVNMPDHFILEPSQEYKSKFRRSAYRINIRSIALKYKLFYLIGDIFPSIEWMKERYNCNGVKVLFYYPHRLGKLLWLV
jgi:hypothetical protein